MAIGNHVCELTILMPCLNEARTLPVCIAKAQAFLARSGMRGEVLVADNGSTDGSQAIATAAGARVIQVPTKGYGAALIAGIHSASGRYVVMGDSDDSYDFSRLDAFLTKLKDGHQLVMGNRFAGGIESGAMPALHRYLGNPVLSFIGRLFFKSPIRDFHCGLRAFDRQAMAGLGLSSPGMEFASEMVVKATLEGLKITEVPTTLSPDGRGRPPHLRSWRDGWRHLRFLLIHAPQWLFLYPGLLLAALGAFFMAALAGGPVFIGRLGLDIHTMLYAMVAFNIGLQMVVFAGLSFMHSNRIGLLKSVPAVLRWFERTTLERSLIVAGSVFASGLLCALGSVGYWMSVGFQETDPRLLMRIAIPAAALLTAGSQLVISAFLLEYVRLPQLAPRAGGRAAGEASARSAEAPALVGDEVH